MTGEVGFGPPPPAAGSAVFGGVLPQVRRYAALLAETGVERGLLGPREVPRLWERHLLNCAVVEELIPHGAEVVDVGSGAGLPGVVLALMRPDLRITLLEPLLRRTVFLHEAARLLELSNVEVRRARAEDSVGALWADVATARAVAPLQRLAGWSLPLLRRGGSLLALKGEQAEAELDEVVGDLARIRPCVADVIRVGNGKVDPATTVIRIRVVGDSTAATGSGRAAGGRRKRGRKR